MALTVSDCCLSCLGLDPGGWHKLLATHAVSAASKQDESSEPFQLGLVGGAKQKQPVGASPRYSGKPAASLQVY